MQHIFCSGVHLNTTSWLSGALTWRYLDNSYWFHMYSMCIIAYKYSIVASLRFTFRGVKSVKGDLFSFWPKIYLLLKDTVSTSLVPLCCSHTITMCKYS